MCALALFCGIGASPATGRAMEASTAAGVVAPSLASVWDESNILESLHVDKENPLRAQDEPCITRVSAPYAVQLEADASTVRIVGAGASPRRLSLRADLLPEVLYLPDGRHALMATRSGWVLRVDLVRARLVAEVRVGLKTNGVALAVAAAGGRSLVAVANAEPHTLGILDENLHLQKLLRVVDASGRITSGVATVRVAATRRSFVASLSEVPELWEISYNPRAPEIGLGLVHDFQYREGQFVAGYLNPQRSTLPTPALDFLLAGGGHEVLTAHPDVDVVHAGANTKLQVTHLDLRRKLAELVLPGRPAVGRSVAWSVDGQDRLAVPNAALGLVSIIDTARWTVLGHIRTDGPVRLLHDLPDSPWLWMDAGTTSDGPSAMLRVNKATLEVQVPPPSEGADMPIAGKSMLPATVCVP